MKKIWLPTWLYNLKPLIVGIVGGTILYVSEDLFTTVFGFLCLGYACWIIIIRLLWSTKNIVKTGLASDKPDKDKTYSAKFPEE